MPRSPCGPWGPTSVEAAPEERVRVARLGCWPLTVGQTPRHHPSFQSPNSCLYNLTSDQRNNICEGLTLPLVSVCCFSTCDGVNKMGSGKRQVSSPEPKYTLGGRQVCSLGSENTLPKLAREQGDKHAYLKVKKEGFCRLLQLTACQGS